MEVWVRLEETENDWKYLATSSDGSRFHDHNLEVLRHLSDCDNIISCFRVDFTVEKGKIIYNILLQYARAGSLSDRINSDRGLAENEVKQYAEFVKSIIVDSYIAIMFFYLLTPIQEKLQQTWLILGLPYIRVNVKQLRGTVLYMATEVVHKYGPQADIWSPRNNYRKTNMGIRRRYLHFV